jgi:hypothetical protein
MANRINDMVLLNKNSNQKILIFSFLFIVLIFGLSKELNSSSFFSSQIQLKDCQTQEYSIEFINEGIGDTLFFNELYKFRIKKGEEYVNDVEVYVTNPEYFCKKLEIYYLIPGHKRKMQISASAKFYIEENDTFQHFLVLERGFIVVDK